MNSLQSPAPIVKRLRSLLNDLDESLKPITSQSLDKLTEIIENRRTKSTKENGNGDEDEKIIYSGRLESAQLQSSLAYILLDLVWILLKLDGTDVNNHPVIAELKRVQQYLEKVHKMDKSLVASEYKSNQNQQKQKQHDNSKIDQSKASRFIKGALGSTTPKKSMGKRTLFAEDGSVQSVLPAGSEEEEKKEEGDDKKERKGEESNEKEWQQPNLKRRKKEKGEKKKDKQA